MIIGSSCSVLTFSGERYDTQGILTKNSDHTVSPWVVYVHITFNNVTNFIKGLRNVKILKVFFFQNCILNLV